eukprot:TRINITY_DN8664_c0_g2_i2.p1 TRINITY_DN8664_c0_g2~~TRINITY_DN8664_c0_g2_i2.p1  ORF type:complete len:554 (-),score=158.21 TRINITY_DN8664_c0_g2_i2:98-1759(-)
MAMRLISVLLLLCTLCSGLNLPGMGARQYDNGARVNLKVNRIDSIKTQLPFDYYSLPFCKPDTITNAAENLGEVMRGERIENSMYELNMNREDSCKVLCVKKYSTNEQQQFTDKISDNYRVHWIVDNLPAATRVYTDDTEQEFSYARGFPLGVMNGKDAYINNHVRILIKYRTSVDNTYEGNRIVGFEVEPFSIKHEYLDTNKFDVPVVRTCPKRGAKPTTEPQLVQDSKEVIFTYDVSWEPSDIRWASRWDLYLTETDDQVHWFSIINSLAMVLLFAFVVAVIMCRTLNTEINLYNDLDLEEDGMKEETGWKLVHGDVFRAPACFNLLTVLVGTGCQLYACSVLVLAVACLGWLGPANRGALGTAMVCFFAFSGFFAGFASSSMYKMFKGIEWKTNVILVAFLYPSICAGIFFFLNLFVWAQGSSAAIPFQHMLIMLFLWVGISVPLVAAGAYFGLRKKPVELPCTPHQIPRLIPHNPVVGDQWLVMVLTAIVGGAACFLPVFIEVYFIMSSIWLHHHHYVFGFLMLVFLILSITCAAVSYTHLTLPTKRIV